MSLAVLLATYNGEKYLEEQIESLLHQTYSDFTVYIHDDGSSDATRSTIKRYRERYPEKITVLDYPATGGAKNNFYSLLQKVESEYYMFCDQDDVWFLNKVEITLKALKALENTDPVLPCLVYTDLRVTDSGLHVITNSLMKKFHYDTCSMNLCSVLAGNIAFGCTMVFNKKCRDIALGIKDINDFTMHDTLMMLIAITCGRVYYLPDATIYYRQHTSNTVGLRDKNQLFWAKEKVVNVIHGRQLQESRKKIVMQKKMINELYFFKNMIEENRTIVCELHKMLSESKVNRMKIYSKYGLLDNSWKNRWKIVLV